MQETNAVRIARVEEKVDNLHTVIEKMEKGLSLFMIKIDKTLYTGNGSKSVIAKIADIESKLNLVWIGIIGFVTAVANAAWKFFVS